MIRRFVDYELDRTKDKENRHKHGMALPLGNYVFNGLYFEKIDTRRDYGEPVWSPSAQRPNLATISSL